MLFRSEIGMDAWAWSALEPWLSERAEMPVGPLFCVIIGRTRGHRWSSGAARLQLHRVAIEAGVRRRFAPHQLRHAHAVELLHEGIPLPLIQRQLGHSHLSTTGTYLQGISSEEIISAIHARRADDERQRRSCPLAQPAGARDALPHTSGASPGQCVRRSAKARADYRSPRKEQPGASAPFRSWGHWARGVSTALGDLAAELRYDCP